MEIIISNAMNYTGVVLNGERDYACNGDPLVTCHKAPTDVLQVVFDTDSEEYRLEHVQPSLDTYGTGFIFNNPVCWASFKNGDLTLDQDWETIVSEVYWSGRCEISYFLRLVLTNHKNTKAGQNVWSMIVKKKLFTHEVLVNIFKYYNHVESIEKLGEKFIHLLNEDAFDINTEASKRHNVVKLPQGVINFVEKYADGRQASTWITLFQEMSTNDPNEIVGVCEALEVFEKLKIPTNRCVHTYYGGTTFTQSRYVGTCIDYLAKIKKMRPDLDLRRLMDYVAKQQFLQYYNMSNSANNIRFAFGHPSIMLRYYQDYLQLGGEELFPQDLIRSHNALSINNDQKLDAEGIKKFELYGAANHELYDRDIDEFEFRMPVNYDNFIKISKTFLNCLPSCGPAFASGLCDIVFIRRINEDIPRYAIELDSSGDLIQAKTLRDMDISEEDVWDAIQKYIPMTKKKMQKGNE